MSIIHRRTIKVGTRKSKLALIQTETALDSIKTIERAKYFDFKTILTESFGDKVLDKPLPSIGGKGVFTEEIEEALSTFRIDIAVHSLKDLPTTFSHDLVIGCLLPRGDRRDAVIFRSPEHKHLSQLGPNCVVGTSSLRRRAFIKKNYPHLIVKDVRGNLNTRFAKLDADLKVYDALVLAAAGVQRMNMEERIGQLLDGDYYAAGQGAIAVQVRKDDDDLIEMLRPLNCRATVFECLAERVFLCRLKAGCSAPVGVHCIAGDNSVLLKGTVMSLDGNVGVADSAEVVFGQGDECDEDVTLTSIAPVVDLCQMKMVSSMAAMLAKRVLDSGGDNILREISLS